MYVCIYKPYISTVALIRAQYSTYRMILRTFYWSILCSTTTRYVFIASNALCLMVNTVLRVRIQFPRNEEKVKNSQKQIHLILDDVLGQTLQLGCGFQYHMGNQSDFI